MLEKKSISLSAHLLKDYYAVASEGGDQKRPG